MSARFLARWEIGDVDGAIVAIDVTGPTSRAMTIWRRRSASNGSGSATIDFAIEVHRTADHGAILTADRNVTSRPR